ncbi:hypothetical protein AB0J80_37195 [Actinoplanes sp. NPDC049548]|uniref:hypothetical protein n=1 Tax=Actinoplanes sp. NPDC049548 TaxID=3155152 RepID=UPI003413FD3C
MRRLDTLAEELETHNKVGDSAKTSKEAETKVQEWLAVLARCLPTGRSRQRHRSRAM